MRALLILFAVALVGCVQRGDEDEMVNSVRSYAVMREGLNEFTHGGCSYLYMKSGYGGGLTHAGDCPNPIHRNDSLTTPHQ